MSTLPLVSAVCCTYNRPLFLRKAIELFCGQTYPNKELVIMNDGDLSTIPDVAGLPIRHVHTSGYEGMTRKQRWAYEIARGDFICTWDDDDFFGPRRMEIQAKALIDGKADACGFPVDYIASTPDGTFWKWKTRTLDTWQKSSTEEKPVGSQVPFHDGSTMFRAELLEGLSKATREGWQLGLLDAMRQKGARLLGLSNDGNFVYVRHGGNAWRFATMDMCYEVDAPPWIPPEMIAFWKQADPARQARAALAAREAPNV